MRTVFKLNMHFPLSAAQRMREAFAEKAEAEKILQVKAAEADAESKYLSGLGVAKQRKAIVDGLKDTVAGFSQEIPGTGPNDVMDLLLVTQVLIILLNLWIHDADDYDSFRKAIHTCSSPPPSPMRVYYLPSEYVSIYANPPFPPVLRHAERHRRQK
jgi:hypothetical protein